MLSNYSAALNGSVWSRLPSSLSQHKNFVFEYRLDPDDIEPHGFSGCGVWMLGSNPAETIWNPDPRLIGVTTNYFRKSCLLAATKLPAFVEMTVVG